jgi:dUTP pyrophosphatase
MKPPKLKIKCHYPGMTLPRKAHPNDSGLDLTLIRVVEKKDGIFFFDTGVSVEPPAGYYTELYPRSSIYKYDFIMTNSVGIIDAGYRGILYLPMRYLGTRNGLEAAEKLIGNRIGQLVLKKLEAFDIEIVEQLSETQRGENGFGSSGT